MVFSATSGFGVGLVGHRPPWGSASVLAGCLYPGGVPGPGRPASLTFSTCCSILSMYTRPTATVFSSATLPFPLPSSMYVPHPCRRRAFFPLLPSFVVVFRFFSCVKYTGCPLFFLFGLFTAWAVLGTISSFLGPTHYYLRSPECDSRVLEY